jgi:hypothetical protein
LMASFSLWFKKPPFRFCYKIHLFDFSNIIGNEVKKMCFPQNIIEQETYRFAEEIRKQCVYKPLRIVLAGNQSLQIKPGILLNSFPEESVPFISKIILEDKNGQLYEIEPTETGIQFAKGDISYQEYARLQKKESTQYLAFFILVLCTFSTMGWGLAQFLL